MAGNSDAYFLEQLLTNHQEYIYDVLSLMILFLYIKLSIANELPRIVRKQIDHFI